MRAMIVAVLLVASGTASAQTLLTAQPSTNGPNYTTANRDDFLYGLPSHDVTPTMAREKLKRATALRAEVAALQKGDGGTLTPEHVAYIQQRVQAIRSYQH